MNLSFTLQEVNKKIISTFSLAFLLAWRDFQARYVGTKAGYFWALLSPLLYAVIFLLLRDQLLKQDVKLDTGGVNPLVFAFFGIMLFQVWYEALTNQLNHLRNATSFLKNIRIVPEVFALSAMIISFLDLGVRVALLIAFMIVFSVPVGKAVLLAPIALLVVVLTGNIVGYILAFPASFFGDINKFIQSISLGIMLVTPIFYTATTSSDSILYWIQVLNPLACTLSLARSVVFGGELIFVSETIIWLLILIPLAVVMFWMYRVITPLIIERL